MTVRVPLLAALFCAPLLTAAPAAAQAQSEAPPVRRASHDWTSDARRFEVGDIIAVLIDEYTIASADRTTTASRDRSQRLGADGSYSAPGGTGGQGGASVRTTNSGESRQRGRDIRQDRLASELTARVTAVEPNGVLRIEGRKKLVIDDHEQVIIVRGLVRPADIMAGNVVDSWRLADAEVSYETNGKLGKPKNGIMSRMLGWIWP